MDPDAFEEMCCALLDKEPGVTRADLYRTRFKAQYGIDAFADHPGGLIVQSDKCYGRVGKGQLASWSDDFLKHWDTVWRDEGVKKFILCVAAPMNSQERLADIKAEKARFKALGVEYEVWAPRQLQERLRPHSGIVSEYLGSQEWVERICNVADDGGAASAALDDMKARIVDLGDALGAQVRARLDAFAKDLDRGQTSGLDAALVEIRNGSAWGAMAPMDQARLVRLQGSAALNRDDLQAAMAFSAEADVLSPPDEPRLKAVIAWRVDGAAAALKALGTPTTDRGRALAVAMLIALERLDDAEAMVATLSVGSAERHRLTGHILLARGQASAALSHLQAAVAASGQEPVNQRLLAMGQYALALSPLCAPDVFLHPQPVAEYLVRQDDAANTLLAQALETFDRLAAGAPAVSARELDLSWGVACRACLKRDDAAKAARALLDQSPTNVYGIGWVLARDLDVDLAASRSALLAALDAGVLEINGPRLLHWLTSRKDQPALLEQVKAGLASNTWTPEVAAELVRLKVLLEGRDDDDGPAAAASRAINNALGDGNWEPVEEAFTAQIAANPLTPLVLGLAEALAGADRWQILAQNAAALSAFQTGDSVTIAAIALQNSGDSKAALDLIETAKPLFAGQRLPFVLRRVEAEALSIVGDPVGAVERAAALAAETNAVDDQLRQAKLFFSLGEAQAAASVVRKLMDDDALDTADALHWSDKLTTEDVDLARQLWRRAVSVELDDRTAASAYVLSFALNLEGERPDLAEAMQRLALAGDKGVRIVALDDVVADVRDQQRRQVELDGAWSRARLPQHIIAQAAGVSLAFFVGLEPDPDNRLRTVFLRHGSRGEAQRDPQPFSTWRLHIDVSALLVADQLDLLPYLDELDEPVRIAAAAGEALREIAEAARDHQPSRAENAQEVIDRLGQGVGTLAPRDAWRVSHEADSEVSPRVIGLGDVLAGLLAAEGIDQTTYDRLLATLGQDGARTETPTRGQVLVFCDQTLDRLVGTPALDAVLDTFDVFIDPVSLQLSRQEIARARRAASVVQRIQRLRRTIARKLRKKTWITVGGDLAQVDGKSALNRAVAQITHAGELDAEARIWFEDRYLTSYVGVGQAPIIEALEVLNGLRAAGFLDASAYYDRLLRLRRGGALFIPMTVDEVLHHLEEAPIADGEVIETEALASLRRHFALSVISEPKLKVQDEPGSDRPLEINAALQARFLAQHAIKACWISSLPSATAAARSTWIWRALRAERLLPPPSDNPSSTADSQEQTKAFATHDLAAMVVVAFSFTDRDRATRTQRRKAYFDWLESEALSLRLAVDLDLRDRLAPVLRDALRVERADKLEPGVRDALRAYLAELTAQLPEVLRNAVGGDKAFMTSLGFGDVEVIKLGENAFRVSEFWPAVAAAVDDEPNSLTSVDGVTCSARALGSSPGGIEFDGLAMRIDDLAVGLLSRDPARQASAVDALLTEFETPREAQDALRAALTTGSLDARMTLVSERRAASFRTFLVNLANAIQKGESVSTNSLLPPPAKTLLRYMRWEQGRDAAQACAALKCDLDSNQALARAVSLPFALPDDLWRDVDLTRQRMITPLSRIHHLRAMRTGVIAGEHDLAAATEAVMTAIETYGELFVTLLRHGGLAFEAQPDWSALSAIEKHVCIWAYAERMTDLLGTCGVDPQAAIAGLKNAKPRGAVTEVFRLQAGYDDSALFAANMTSVWLLLAGLEYALGQEADHLKLSDTQRAALRAQLTWTLSDGTTTFKPVRSLFAADPPIETWLNRPTPRQVDEDGAMAETLIDQTLDALEASPDAPPTWNVLYNYGPPALTGAQRLRLTSILARIDLETLLAAANDPGVSLRQVADLAGRLAPHASSEAFLNSLVGLAARWIPQVDEEAFIKRLADVVEAAAAAARSPIEDGGERFFGFVRALLTLRGDIGPALWPVLDRIVDATPISEATDLWRALIQARAY